MNQELFRKLNESGIGKELVVYLQDLQAKVCDSRNWGPNEDKTHANKVANVIQTDIIDKIVLRTRNAEPVPYQYD